MYLQDSDSWFITVDSNRYSDWELFSLEQKILHEIYLELCSCTKEDEIYEKIIEHGYKSFGLDFIEIKSGDSCLTKENRINFVQVLRTGQGWVATSTFYYMGEIIGCIRCNNSVLGRPLLSWKKQIIAGLARITGQLIRRLRRESTLIQMIDERVLSIRDNQKNLVEIQQLASLGSLVTGVAHELNTPIGIAITSTSFIQDSIYSIKRSITNKNLKQTEFIKSLETMSDSGSLAKSSLKKALVLVNNFKKMTIDSEGEGARNFNLYDLIQTIFSSLKLGYQGIDLTLLNNIDYDYSVYANFSDYLHIFSHLMENSIIHGFEDRENGTISISLIEKDGWMIITYSNNGKQIESNDINKIYEPFYTTKRHLGTTGLGMSIVHNTIVKLKGNIHGNIISNGTEFIIHLPL